MTDYPIACDKSPIAVDLIEGDRYSFCPCGLSKTQPFCDGAHKEADTDIRSLKFVAERTGTHWLCMCKHTKKPPFCDGSHSEV